MLPLVCFRAVSYKKLVVRLVSKSMAMTAVMTYDATMPDLEEEMLRQWDRSGVAQRTRTDHR